MTDTTWDGPTDSDGEPCRYTNHYTCEDCDVSWEDQWSCACDDDCPECGATIEVDESNYDGEVDDE